MLNQNFKENIEKKQAIFVGYIPVNQIITEVYRRPSHTTKYNFIKAEDVRDSLELTVEPQPLSPHLCDAIAEGRWPNLSTRAFLCDLCHIGKIPAGYYVISASRVNEIG